MRRPRVRSTLNNRRPLSAARHIAESVPLEVRRPSRVGLFVELAVGAYAAALIVFAVWGVVIAS